MKRLFQIILVLVILLLITIHQAIAGNTKHVELRNDKGKVKVRLVPCKGIKDKITPAQPDIVKECVTKRNIKTNVC